MEASTVRGEILRGLREAAPVGLGLIPLGLAFGVLVAQAGHPWWWAPVFSLVIYAGSMEFLALGLVGAAVPLPEVALTTFLVNFRHIFYGLSFPLRAIRSRVGRVYSVYALTDESYAIAATRDPASTTGARVLTIQAVCQTLWVLPGVVGAVLGAAIPAELEGLGFALTALFVVLAIDAFRVRRDAGPVLLAGACGVAAMLIDPDGMLVLGLGAFVLALVVRYVAFGRHGRVAPASGAGR